MWERTEAPSDVVLAKYKLNATSDAVPTAGPTPPDTRLELVYPEGIVVTSAPEMWGRFTVF